jgi:hypothetical protein
MPGLDGRGGVVSGFEGAQRALQPLQTLELGLGDGSIHLGFPLRRTAV